MYDYCIKNKIVDAALIAKWKKPGYERLCSTYTINQKNYKFGTVSICRVPKQFLPPGTEIEDPTTGCRGCASGSGGEGNIFGNRYGQYLAAIQISREERAAKLARAEDGGDEEDDDDEDGHGPKAAGAVVDDRGPVGAADGSSGEIRMIWAADGEHVELSESMIGTLDSSAEREGRAAARHSSEFARTTGEKGRAEAQGSGKSSKRARQY